MPTGTMTLQEVSELTAGDVLSMCGVPCKVSESGPRLDDYYQNNGRYDDYSWGVRGKFWDKVKTVAEILKDSTAWPFEPIEVSRDKKTLYDGHHRSNAAILAGWDKPIPVKFWTS